MSASACVAMRSEITGNAVVMEISEATKITISSAGSARKPTIISRRAPMRAEGGADVHRRERQEHTGGREQTDQRDGVGRRSERQARAHRRDDGRGHDHGAEHDVGSEIEQARGVSATTASLWNSLRMPRYACSTLGARRFCSQARHWLSQPRNSGAAASATRHLEHLRDPAHDGHHSTSASSTIRVTKL